MALFKTEVQFIRRLSSPATPTSCFTKQHGRVAHTHQGRVKLLSAAGSTAVLFNGIKERWCLARKILFLVLMLILMVILMIIEILTILAWK